VSMFSWPGTVRAQLFAVTLTMSALVSALGVYAYLSIEDAGDIVAYTYEYPLTAISFARSSAQRFSHLQLETARGETVLAAGDVPDLERIAGLANSFLKDISVVEDRALTARSRRLATEVADDMRGWSQDLADGLTIEKVIQLSTIAPRVALKLNQIIEIQAGEAYRDRVRAEAAIGTTTMLTVAATGAALALTLIIGTVLGSRIVNPLREAAAAADRIAGGELETEIPAGGRNETGALLRSMTFMQKSIREALTREKSLRESAQIRLIEALEASAEGIVLLNSDGSVALSNTQMQMFFPALARSLSDGVAFNQLFRPDGTPISGMDEDAGPINVDGEFKMASGRWLRASRSMAPDGSRFIVWSEVTHAKEREAACLDALDRAEEASAAKSRFLRNMSHELRTPLNAIIGFSEMIHSEVFGPIDYHQYKDYAGEIHGSGKALLSVINCVLSIAEGGDISDRPKVELNAADIIEDCIDLCREEARVKNVGLAVSGVSGPLMIKGDLELLRQAVTNILSNAIKFNKSGGQVDINLGRTAGSLVEIRISDTGIGMSDEDIALALEPFGQVDGALTRMYSGSGLGLPLAKSIVDAHGGRLSIESMAGKGVRVSISLPQPQHLRLAAVG